MSALELPLQQRPSSFNLLVDRIIGLQYSLIEIYASDLHWNDMLNMSANLHFICISIKNHK